MFRQWYWRHMRHLSYDRLLVFGSLRNILPLQKGFIGRSAGAFWIVFGLSLGGCLRPGRIVPNDDDSSGAPLGAAGDKATSNEPEIILNTGGATSFPQGKFSSIGFVRNDENDYSNWWMDVNDDRTFSRLDDVSSQFGQLGDQPLAGPCSLANTALIAAVRNEYYWYESHNNFLWDNFDHTTTSEWGVDGVPAHALYVNGKATSYRKGIFYYDANDTRDWEDGTDGQWSFGEDGDIPVAGYFGRQTDEGELLMDIGVFRGGKWWIDLDGNKEWSPPSEGGSDEQWFFGVAGDLPIVGNFADDGRSEIGTFRDGLWRIDGDGDRRLTPSDPSWEFGMAGDIPVVAPEGWYGSCE